MWSNPKLRGKPRMRPPTATRLLCIVLIANLVASPLAYAQQDSTTSANIPTPPPAPAPATSAPSPVTGPLSDYVPCMFKGDDEFAMRAQTPDKVLDGASP